METETTLPPVEAPIKKGHGCFFYGCLTSIILVFVLGVGGYFLVKRMIGSFVASYTTTQAMEIPIAPINPAISQSVDSRIQTFSSGLESGQKTSPLSLTSDEINTLIATRPDLEPLRGHVFVDIKGDKISGKVSVPLEQLGLAGRFLNGEGTFRVSLDHGSLFVGVESLVVNGASIPEMYMSELRKQNFAQEISADDPKHEWMKKLDRISVENGVLTIIPSQNVPVAVEK